MFIIIRNIDVYGPEFIGRRDILICNDKLVKIAESIGCHSSFEAKEIDGSGLKAVPGFIDQHVHFIGGGGEGGPATRTPEIKISDLTKAGITTALGLLGTDDITRNSKSLLAKARALEEEGITTYIYTGNYTIPFETLTGTIQSDVVLIDKVIGVGEVAMSDHRSSQPNLDDFKKLSANARVGGILAGKAGIVHIHLGDGKEGIGPLMEIAKSTEIPLSQFMPTHINRIEHLTKQSVEYLKMGGYVDLTSGFYKSKDSPKSYSISDALKLYIDNGCPLDHVCSSSDSNGSMPVYDSSGELSSIGVCSSEALFKDVRSAIKDGIVTLEQGIGMITCNPAKVLKLYPRKGAIREKSDADLVLLDSELNIHTVIAKGQIMVKDGEAVVKSYFEK